MSAPSASTTRAQALSLYRKLIRIGKAMPTENRSRLVLTRVRGDFRENLHETDPEEIQAMIQLAELQVDNLEIQKNHLTELSKNPNLIIPVDIYKDAKPKVNRFMKGAPLSWERKATQEKSKTKSASSTSTAKSTTSTTAAANSSSQSAEPHFDKASQPRAKHSCKSHDHTHHHHH